MGTPTKATVKKADLSLFVAQGEKLESYAKNIEDEVGKLSRRIYGLDWKGTAKTAAEVRADSEVTQQNRLAEGVRSLKDALVDGANAMQPMIDSLKTSASNLEGNSYEVSDGWSVSDLLNYVAAMALAKTNDDEDQLRRLEALQTQRAEVATNETTRLQRLAVELGTADETANSAIQAATVAIAGLSPAVAGMNSSQAHADLEAARAGKATPEQLARLSAAATLTPEQMNALNNGETTQLPKGQFDYLNQLMRDMDGLSPAQIQDLADNTPGAESSIANALQIMANPKVVGASPGESGGMARLPDKVQQLLQQNPVKDRNLVRTEKKSDILGNSFEDKSYIPAVEIVGYHDLNALTGLLDSGNPVLRDGTDLDRGLLKQTSEIAAAVTATTKPIVDENGVTLGDAEINDTLDGMLDVASADHQAVRDFLTGDNMAATVDHGGTYDPNSHFMGLVTHDWGDEDGAIKLFDWIGASAPDPGYEGRLSADAANSLAHLISTNHAVLGQDVDPTNVTQTLGQVNPELTQTLTKNLIPYLGGLNGIDVEGLHDIAGFSTTDELAKMIKVLDSDPTSAAAINLAAAEWEQKFSNMYAQTLAPDYAEAAGRMTQAVISGNSMEMEALKSNKQWDAIQDFNGASAEWDSIKGIVSAGLGYIPGGSEISKLYDIADPYAKLSNIELPNDPNNITPGDWEKAVDQSDDLYQQTTDGRYRQYALAQGYLAAHDGATADPGWEPFITTGKLDWSKIVATEDSRTLFSELFETLGLGGYNDPNDGYPNGLNSPNITLDDKPAPGDSSVTPK